MIDRHSVENVDKNSMNFNQTRRMGSERLQSDLVKTKNDWKKNDTLLNKHKINTKTNWINRELNFNKTFHKSVDVILNKNNFVDDKTDNAKLNLAMQDVQLAETHQKRIEDWKSQRDNTVKDRSVLNQTWNNDDSKLRETVKGKEKKIFTHYY